LNPIIINPLTRVDSFKEVDFNTGCALLLDKPAGWTSFDVVNKVRYATKARKVGHTGTLDPAATGLLIVLTGAATRSQAHFTGLDKEYQATILLGTETNTWDMDGTMVSQQEVPALVLDTLNSLIQQRFVGKYEQIPPAFSALKKNGIPAYRQARKGIVETMDARQVEVEEIRLLGWLSPELSVQIKCSSGFYVRSLAHDLGQELMCGGTLKKLIRTAVGNYRLEDANSLAEVIEKISACRPK
jgi:tRNA pseudouridine55 synthase